MNIKEIINNISIYPEEGSIFAEKKDNKYHPDSEAVIIEMTDDELKEKTSVIANKKCPGKSYFLEVFLVNELLEDMKNNYKNTPLSINEIVECIIYYAENDSYPEKFFG